MVRKRVTEAPISTRPASVKPQGSPFVKQKKKSGSKKLGLNWDKVEESYNHRLNIEITQRQLALLRSELIEAEAKGMRKANRLRREINALTEQMLALQSTWCQGCMNYAHRCKCDGIIKRKSIRQRERRKEAREERQIAGMKERIQAARVRLGLV
jgi:hypothetical protein